MSHFISGVDIEGPLVFHMTPPQIVKPRIKRYLKSNTIQGLFSRSCETKLIDHVCHRFSQMQQQNLKMEKELFISNKCSTLRKKFKASFNPNPNGSTVQGFFKEQPLSLNDQLASVVMNLKNLAQGMPQKIELEKKYHSQLNIKMMSVSQAKRITVQKEQYKSWLNSTNSCINSPNFSKMTFLFEKLKKRQSSDCKFQNQEQHCAGLGNIGEFVRSNKQRVSAVLKENAQIRFYKKKQRNILASLNQSRNNMERKKQV